MSNRKHLPVDCWCGQSWDLRNQPPVVERAERLYLDPFDDAPDDEKICENCGDDLVCQGFIWCSDCLESEYS